MTTRRVAETISENVRRVPHVRGLFPSHSAPVAGLRSAIAVLTDQEPEPDIRIRAHDGDVTITVRASVDREAPAIQTAEAIRQAVADSAVLFRAELGDPVISVQIAYVD